MSSQIDAVEWRTLAKTHSQGVVLPRHQHRTGQLVFAVRGVMLIETELCRWTVPPQRALWVPPNEPHAIEMLSDVELRTIYFEPLFISKCSSFVRQDSVHAINATVLLKALIQNMFESHLNSQIYGLNAQLLLSTLYETASMPTQLLMPKEAKLRQALNYLISNNKWDWPMSELASYAAMSERNFSRKFTSELGVNFRTWRQQARLIASLNLLDSQMSIKSIANVLQFKNSAAYVAAFRTLLGDSPAAFRRNEIT